MTGYEKLQIIGDIFSPLCFTPYVKVYGNTEIYYAKSKLRYFNDWSYTPIEWWQEQLRQKGARLEIDMDIKAFRIHFLTP